MEIGDREMMDIALYKTAVQPLVFLLGLTVSLVLKFLLQSRILNMATKSIELQEYKPQHMDKVVFESLTKTRQSGEVIGYFETFLFFIALWSLHAEFIGGLLAFKVTAKWEVWKNIVKVPDHLKGVDDAQFFDFRHRLGAFILTRFIIGTFSNIVFAWIGHKPYGWYFHFLSNL